MLGVAVLTVGMAVLAVIALVLGVVVLVVVSGISGDEALWQELHAALGAATGLCTHDLCVHRADVDDLDAFRYAHVHLGDERERLVGLHLKEGLDPLA